MGLRLLGLLGLGLSQLGPCKGFRAYGLGVKAFRVGVSFQGLGVEGLGLKAVCYGFFVPPTSVKGLGLKLFGLRRRVQGFVDSEKPGKG